MKGKIFEFGKEQGCHFPGCTKKEVWKNFELEITNEEVRIQIPFCVFHTNIVMGNFFWCEKIGEMKYEFCGPVETVEIALQCLAAVEMVKLLAEKKSAEDKNLNTKKNI